MGIEARHDLRGCRALVVEDEFFIAADVADALTLLGAEVVGPVPTCREALALLARGEPLHFAVLDINLHGELAHAVADALAARGVPFVFATGYDPAMVPDRFRHVLRWEKPFDPGVLASALADLVAGGWVEGRG